MHRLDCKFCPECVNAKDGLLLFTSIDCNKNYEKEFHRDSTERFESTYRFFDEDMITR